jgi:hypothetical protein
MMAPDRSPSPVCRIAPSAIPTPIFSLFKRCKTAAVTVDDATVVIEWSDAGE